MFTAQETVAQEEPATVTNVSISAPVYGISQMTSSNLDKILEKEKQSNKADSWNKLDNTVKIQALHAFAETYGKEKSLPVKTLKTFFNDCLRTNKLNKTKDVKYDRDTRTIVSIPALFFNTASHNYTLRIVDTKRVSTLKSLTPKRNSIKNTEEGEREEDKIE
jgi:hypothetical protein